VRWLPSWERIVRQLPASKDVNTEAESDMALEADTRRLVKRKQAEKIYMCALVNCKVCELMKRL
jgi:hypothetical protein